jgi:hypothetical protein
MKLPARLRRTLATLARVVCAPRHEPSPATFEALADEVEAFLGSVPAMERAGIVGALWAIELRGGGFSMLDLPRAEALFARWWESSTLHAVARILKMVVTFAWWELPEVKREMGYTPERWIAEASARRLASWKDEIAAKEQVPLAPDPLIKRAPHPEAEKVDAVAHR